jgi:hypothetical protein
MRILRGLARLAHKRFQFFDPTRQRLDQRRLLTDDPILVGFAQKREWGTIHPKIDSETKPLRKPIFANHVSSYAPATRVHNREPAKYATGNIDIHMTKKLPASHHSTRRWPAEGYGLCPSATISSMIEISLRNGRSLKAAADIDRRMLSSLIVCVETA